MVHINRSQWVLKKNLSGQLHQCFKFSTWFIETKDISPQTRESLDPLILQTHIKFVILLTVNHTIYIMLVQRIKYWINWLSPNWLMGVNSHEWPRQNLSLQYQYNIKQKMNKNTEKKSIRSNKLIQYQILQTNIRRIVWQMVRRITNEIIEVKELKTYSTSWCYLTLI